MILSDSTTISIFLFKIPLILSIFLWLKEDTTYTQSFRYIRFVRGDTKISFEIIKEPKLLDKWLNPSSPKFSGVQLIGVGTPDVHRLVSFSENGHDFNFRLNLLENSKDSRDYADAYNLSFNLESQQLTLKFSNKITRGLLHDSSLIETKVDLVGQREFWSSKILSLGSSEMETKMNESIKMLDQEIERQYKLKVEWVNEMEGDDTI